MTPGRYALAGWLAIAQAVLFFPTIALALFFEWISRRFPGSVLLAALLQVLGVAAGVYVLLAFRSLLHEVEDFRAADLLITLLIWISLASAGLGLLGLLSQSNGLPAAWTVAPVVLTGGLLAAHGIVSIVFGRRLLSMKDDLSGLLKPFAHTTVASGALTLTVVGAPIGLALALAAIVMQGMILLRANEDVQFV